MFHVEVLEDNFPVDDISKEISKIKKECNLELDWSSILVQSEDGKSNPLTNLPENYYSKTIFESAKTINRIIDKYGLVKTELTKLKPRQSTQFTRSLSKRVFVPILYPLGNYTIVDGKSYSFEPGRVYLVNTTLSYVLVNASDSSRVELIGRMYS